MGKKGSWRSHCDAPRSVLLGNLECYCDTYLNSAVDQAPPLHGRGLCEQDDGLQRLFRNGLRNMTVHYHCII